MVPNYSYHRTTNYTRKTRGTPTVIRPPSRILRGRNTPLCFNINPKTIMDVEQFVIIGVELQDQQYRDRLTEILNDSRINFNLMDEQQCGITFVLGPQGMSIRINTTVNNFTTEHKKHISIQQGRSLINDYKLIPAYEYYQNVRRTIAWKSFTSNYKPLN